MKCNNCSKFFTKRTQYLVHASICGGPERSNLHQNYYSALSEESLEDESDVFDDTDEDPSWCLSPTHQASPDGSQASSLLTEEQQIIAETIEGIIDPATWSDDWPSQIKNRLVDHTDEDPDQQSPTSPTCKGEEDVSNPDESCLFSISLDEEVNSNKNGQNGHEPCLLSTEAAKCKLKLANDGVVAGPVAEEVRPSMLGAEPVSTKNKAGPAAEEERPSMLEAEPVSIKNKRKSCGRKKNFCNFCESLVTNFCRHIETHHYDKEEGKSLIEINNNNLTPKEKKVKKQSITDPLRKKFNAEWNKKTKLDKEKYCPLSIESLYIPVKLRHSPTNRTGNETDSVQCKHCLGMYLSKKLCVHIKHHCPVAKKNRGSPLKSPKKTKIQALRQNSLPIINYDKNVSAELKSEILTYMKNDTIASAARNDPLILQMGSEFHKSRRHSTEKKYCSREMRDMGRLLLELKKRNTNITQLQDCFTPKYFGDIVKAVECLNGYDQNTGTVRVGGLAYRILQPLQHCLRIHRANVVEDLHATSSKDRYELELVNDFIQTVKDKWSDLLGRHSIKSLKTNKSVKTDKMALETDIKTLCSYIQSKYESVILHVEKNQRDCHTYDLLVDMLLTHIMCLARRRPVDLSRGTLEHYNMVENNENLISSMQDKFSKEEIETCNRFKVFFVPGKKYEKVPIVLTNSMDKAMETLISLRTHVGITNNTLFSHSQNKAIDASQSLKRMKNNVKLIKPNDLSCNGLRHHAATFSKLDSTHPLYQDHLATSLGHTLHIHKKNYDLPTAINQKLIVYPVLHNMTVDKSEIVIQNQPNHNQTTPTNSDDEEQCLSDSTSSVQPKGIKRKRWTDVEKEVVYKRFGSQILAGICPKFSEIERLKQEHSEIFKNQTISRLYTFIYNSAQRKVKNVTPDVKRFKKN